MATRHGSTRRQDLSRVLVFERKVLRKINGPFIDFITGELRRRYITELNQLYIERNIVGHIKNRRLKWLVTMSEGGGQGWRQIWRHFEEDLLEHPGKDGRMEYRKTSRNANMGKLAITSRWQRGMESLGDVILRSHGPDRVMKVKYIWRALPFRWNALSDQCCCLLTYRI